MFLQAPTASIPPIVLPPIPEGRFYAQWDFWVSLGTMLLAMVTAWLALETRRMRRGADRALEVMQSAMWAQSEDTHRSLDIARRNADAALMSASANQEQIAALRRQDRAWIIVSPPNMEKLAGFGADESILNIFYAPIVITNHGKGIAMITCASARFQVLTRDQELPPEPEYPSPYGRKMEGGCFCLHPHPYSRYSRR